MSFIKKFESYMTEEEMKNHLCRCGYSEEELENCSEEELRTMCRNQEEEEMQNLEEKNKFIQDTKMKKDLSKNIRGFNEHQETQNYMFFSNLQTIKRLVDEMLEMDETELDHMLTEHDWASDHISVATENIEHVFNFVAGHEDPISHEEDYEDEIPGGNWNQSEMSEGDEEFVSGELETEGEISDELEAQKESFRFIKKFGQI